MRKRKRTRSVPPPMDTEEEKQPNVRHGARVRKKNVFTHAAPRRVIKSGPAKRVKHSDDGVPVSVPLTEEKSPELENGSGNESSSGDDDQLEEQLGRGVRLRKQTVFKHAAARKIQKPGAAKRIEQTEPDREQEDSSAEE
jgi:hypothetical protein